MHSKLGHSSLSTLGHIIPKITHMNKANFHCDTYVMSKHHKLSYELSHKISPHPFHLIHIDLWGSYRIKSLTGTSYFFTIVDDLSRMTLTILLKDKTFVSKTL